MSCFDHNTRILIFVIFVGCIITLVSVPLRHIIQKTFNTSSNPRYASNYSKDGIIVPQKSQPTFPLHIKTVPQKNQPAFPVQMDTHNRVGEIKAELLDNKDKATIDLQKLGYSISQGNEGYVGYKGGLNNAANQKHHVYSNHGMLENLTHLETTASTINKEGHSAIQETQNYIPLRKLYRTYFLEKTKSTNTNSGKKNQNKIQPHEQKFKIQAFPNFIPYRISRTLQPSKSLINPSCERKRNRVAFLKVHKAGSTTTVNIFLRFAVNNDLNIVVPKRWVANGFNYLGYENITTSLKNAGSLSSIHSNDILCKHVFHNGFDSNVVVRMPNDTPCIGIIRDPRTHFISASNYYGFYRNLRQFYDKHNNSTFYSNILSEFLKHTRLYENVSTLFVHNRMSYDFGLLPKYFKDKNYIDIYLRKLENDFQLVMILEYFYESLVLMKRLLCWDFKDILFIPLNVNRRKHKIQLSTKDVHQLSVWNYADFKLYEHFNKTFWKKVQNEGADFFDEVKHFKALQLNISLFCQNFKQGKFIYVKRSRWNTSFNVTQEDCTFMRQFNVLSCQRKDAVNLEKFISTLSNASM